MTLSLLPAAAWAAAKEIRSVSLTISAPVHGSRPSYTAECGDSSYEVATTNIGGFTNGVKWYDDTTQKQMDSTLDICVSGHNYTVTVFLEPTDFDQFSFKHPDIKPNDYWYKAILWASEKGIANGTGNGQYSPNMTCSRAHIVTFLYRTAGEPNKTGTGTWYTDAVNWANANKIITGTAEVFNPTADCPRSDVVLYLFRQLAK